LAVGYLARSDRRGCRCTFDERSAERCLSLLDARLRTGRPGRQIDGPTVAVAPVILAAGPIDLQLPHEHNQPDQAAA